MRTLGELRNGIRTLEIKRTILSPKSQGYPVSDIDRSIDGVAPCTPACWTVKNRRSLGEPVLSAVATRSDSMAGMMSPADDSSSASRSILNKFDLSFRSVESLMSTSSSCHSVGDHVIPQGC
jgi:hypothetical protein